MSRTNEATVLRIPAVTRRGSWATAACALTVVVALASVVGCADEQTSRAGESLGTASVAVGDGAAISEFLGLSVDVMDPTAGQTPAQIADCMVDRGFDYVAAPSPIDIAERELTGSSMEWLERYGFGASTLLYSQDEVGDRAVGYDLDDMAGAADPNAAILASLDEGRREAYEIALFGGPTGGAGDVPCVFGGVSPDEWSVVQAFQSTFAVDLTALESAVFLHPQYLAFETRVASCLSERGLNWTNRDQAVERFLAIAASLGVDGLDTDDLDALAELQRGEIELAFAEHQCGGSNEARQDVEARARADLERQFVADHREELSALSRG